MLNLMSTLLCSMIISSLFNVYVSAADDGVLPDGSAGGDTSCQICLPDTVYAVVSRQVDIRYEQLLAQIPATSGYAYTCQSQVGYSDSAGFHYTPAEPSVAEVSIGVVTRDGQTVLDAVTHVKAVSQVCITSRRSVLFVGDSIIAAHPASAPDSSYVVTGFLARALTAGGEGVRLIGTQGIEPGLHEGYNGKRWTDFTSPHSGYFQNPFWDSVEARIDFQRYMDVTGQEDQIEKCIVQNGYNDVLRNNGEKKTEKKL